MARRPQKRKKRKPAPNQIPFDFEALQREQRAAFVERNNELRSRLRSIEVSFTGLTARKWEQVCELLMSVWIHTRTGNTTCASGTAGGATTCPPNTSRREATTRLAATAGLTPRQFRKARTSALRLSLLRSVRSYAGDTRTADQLEVDPGGVDRLVEQSRAEVLRTQKGGCRGAATGLQPPSELTTYPRARAGAALELPITFTTTTSAGVGAKATAMPATAEVVVAVNALVADCRRLFGDSCPERIEPAICEALAAGCTIEQLRRRCRWILKHQHRWPIEHRPGTIHDGIKLATPNMTDTQGWPYR